ncbi:MAG: leucyl aminopeptidase [Thermodesulfobacteriota bacterium]
MEIVKGKRPRFATQILFLTPRQAKRIPDFSGKEEEITVRYVGRKTEILCGLGEDRDMGLSVIRSQTACALRKAVELRRDCVSVLLPDKTPADPSRAGMAAVEGALLGAYSFSRYKSEKPGEVKTCQIVGLAGGKALARTIEACKAVHYARDLVNENASIVTPERLAKEALALASLPRVKVTVFREAEIAENGLSLLAAVGRGAEHGPRLAIIEYEGAPGRKARTALIGKGITFDTGGLNLKAVGSMETMRDDMAGAAAVLGALRAAALSGARVNVLGIVAAAHNAISDRSFIPGDVYPSYSGKTVEIGNTDAEGRLVLADAISYCVKNLAPTAIIDFATLTGSCVIALGDTIAGLFSNNDQIAQRLFAAGEEVNERLWRMPVRSEHYKAMKSDRADLSNSSRLKRGTAGAITAAAFLSEFVEGTPWAHLDIAGTAFNESEPRGEVPRYATGFGVRLALRFLCVI